VTTAQRRWIEAQSIEAGCTPPEVIRRCIDSVRLQDEADETTVARRRRYNVERKPVA
jgi:hypothetical protein